MVVATSAELKARGRACGPVLDISHSPHFNLCWLRALEWLLFLLEYFPLRSFAVEPPCAKFSPAAFPALRSYTEPRNYNPLEGQTLHGTTLALMLFIFVRLGVPGILEQRWPGFLSGSAFLSLARPRFWQPAPERVPLLASLR